MKCNEAGDYNQKQRCRELIMEINKAREKEYVDITLDYYDVNAESFCFGTQNAAFSEHQDTFLSYLPPQASILDLGCGSRRDSRAFLHKGYDVEAMDGSKELCRLASQCIGKEVKCCKFQELEAENLYDGIWACASIPAFEYGRLRDGNETSVSGAETRWYFVYFI